MTRHLIFRHAENQYVLIENEQVVFSIDEKELQFNSFQFYQGIYADKTKSTRIVLSSDLEDKDRIGRYIENWLGQIINKIADIIGDAEEVTLAQDDNMLEIVPQRRMREIVYYDLPVCAGNGLYTDSPCSSRLTTSNQEADYAIKLSGHSMEPIYTVEVFIILAKILLDFHGFKSDQYHTQKEKEDHIMILNTHPENRKAMVKAICELTGMNAMYLFTPTYAYQIGPITVSRDGSIVCEDEAMLSTIKLMLIERGWLEAEAQSEMPAEPESSADFKDMPETAAPISVEQMDITMPIPGWTVAQATNLLRMLCSKQILINRMIDCDMLFIEESFVRSISENPPESITDLEARVQKAIEAGSICGFWFSDGQVTLSTPFAQDEPTRWTAYADLLRGMLRIAETATRISVKQLDDPENEKYHANSWLMRMGLRGPGYKETRRILMGHLTGFAAFRSAADMQAHKERMARKRREGRQDEQSNT